MSVAKLEALTCVAGRWFVIRSLPNREAAVSQGLQQQGFKMFLPQVRRTVRHARKFSTRNAPLFPSYYFVQIDPARDRWCSINGAISAIGLIMAHERPSPWASSRASSRARWVGSYAWMPTSKSAKRCV
jgi:transcription antitermination factor NusG